MADNPLLSSLVEAWGGDETALPDHQNDPFPDETNSYGVSTFIRLGRRYLVGVVSDHEFVDGIQLILGRLRDAMHTHRAQWPLLRLTQEQLTLALQVDKAFLDFSDGLSEMVASFTQKDLQRVEKGMLLCKTATAILERWERELVRLERKEIALVCATCGRINGALSPVCSACQEPLPGLEEEYDPDLDFVNAPAQLVRFFEATMQAASGSSPVSLWAMEADRLRSALLCAQASVKDIGAWDSRVLELAPGLSGRVQGLSQSLGLALQALTQMQQFPVTHELRLLDEGWFHLLWQFPLIHEHAYHLRMALDALLEHLSSEDFVAFAEGDGEYEDEPGYNEE